VTNRSSVASCVPLTYVRNMELLEIDSNHADIYEHMGTWFKSKEVLELFNFF